MKGFICRGNVAALCRGERRGQGQGPAARARCPRPRLIASTSLRPRRRTNVSDPGGGVAGGPPGHPFGLQTLPYGSFTAAGRLNRPRVGVAIGDQVLDLTSATDRLLTSRADLFMGGRLDPLLDAGDRAWAQIRTAVTAWLSRDEYRDAIEDLLVPAANVDTAAAVHGRRLRRLLRLRAPRDQRRPDLPARQRAADCRTGGTCRSAITAGPGPSWSPAPRSVGRTASPGARRGRARVRALGPARHRGRGRLRRRRRQPSSASRSRSSRFRRARVRCVPGQRLVRPRHPGLGVRRRSDRSSASRSRTSISPWVVPLAALEHARIRPPSRDTELLPYLDRADGLGPGHRLRGQTERARDLAPAVRGDVLDPGADAGPPDRERGVAADRGPVRVGHRQRRPSPASAAACSS